MEERENIEKTSKKRDGMDQVDENSNADHLRSLLAKHTQQQSIGVGPVNFEVTDNKIPHRGTPWYVAATILFISVSGFAIYQQDWSLLFFMVVFSGVILWRGHRGVVISLEINEGGVRINKKQISFNEIETFYFSKLGDDITVTFKMVKKYYPQMAFILASGNDAHSIKQRLVAANIHQSDPREEGYIDLVIRKIKL